MNGIDAVFTLFVLMLNIWMSVRSSHPPITVKRKLTYVTTKTTWKDAQATCSTLFNGSLVKDSSFGISNMISLYQQEDWSMIWDDKVWIGMFVSDIGTPVYKWTSDCSVHDTYLFRRFDIVPLAADLYPDKRCIFEKSSLREWIFDGCDSTIHSSLCEEIIGPCTYEHDNVTGACTTGIVSTAAIIVSSMQQCEEYCTAIKPLTITFGQCWSVTYDAISGYCFPAIGEVPYAFDVNTTGYQAICLNSDVTSTGNDSIVSWKRCFEEPGVFTDLVLTSLPLNSYDPNVNCEIPSTTHNYESTHMTETTSGEGTTHVAETTSGRETVQTTVASEAECSCDCYKNGLTTLQERIIELQEETRVQKKETSAYYRKLNSASDNRTSACVVGLTMGAGVIMTVVIIITIGDIMMFCKFLIYLFKQNKM